MKKITIKTLMIFFLTATHSFANCLDTATYNFFMVGDPKQSVVFPLKVTRTRNNTAHAQFRAHNPSVGKVSFTLIPCEANETCSCKGTIEGFAFYLQTSGGPTDPATFGIQKIEDGKNVLGVGMYEIRDPLPPFVGG